MLCGQPLTKPYAVRKKGRSEVIAFNLSGHGLFDLGAYDEYMKGNLERYAYPESENRGSDGSFAGSDFGIGLFK